MTHSSAEASSYTDFVAFPSPYLKAMLVRLRTEMFSAACALQGELLDAFWASIDELNDLRRAEPSTSWQRSNVPERLVVLDGERQKALLMRLRIDMFSVARSLSGPLLDEFWTSVDELAMLRLLRRAPAPSA